ncbi:2-amino-4-hydroxy-6-hydroxymethyldihydropteridine diphosphokinase [Ferrimonas lipolytica]|uniref:2-amino-4-hydroxy-6-hydroxymethyldihydropteridine pyrophosphokinase n=1 Tax=Ferrimonas lipolytica TaxID=2724191 RepID=A0A6H1UF64_9GAMM|nr:2-amino-4-hydroxy-6-hydroxymethyldihydropteridine diphosphokinase [Ferrimonas lipolytica]QIZ77684.1 2-amino-4-hydroxy-6-hydroxymethyldihydropteridine diphosphokinase [Ferrimonas lipolytica]
MIRCYIALGANLAQPDQQLRQALQALAQLPQTSLVSHSQLYRSPPMAGMVQPDYCNAVAAIDTALSPIALLDHLQQLEHNQGRERHSRWGARTLDLDILLYGDQQIESERLTVPHYGIAERIFVLLPLFELAPALLLPDGKPLVSLVSNCPPQPLSLY